MEFCDYRKYFPGGTIPVYGDGSKIAWFKPGTFRIQIKIFKTIQYLAGNLQFKINYHIHKKREDSLEIWVVLSIFLFELEISEMAKQSIHQNSGK